MKVEIKLGLDKEQLEVAYAALAAWWAGDRPHQSHPNSAALEVLLGARGWRVGLQVVGPPHWKTATDWKMGAPGE